MIVEAVDGWYYLDPVAFGEKSYLTFGAGFPEVVVQSKSFNYGRRIARRWGKVIEDLDAMKRAFPPDFSGLRPSVSYRVELAGPIPIPEVSGGRVDSLSPGESLTWTAAFTREEVLSLWTDRPSQKLLQWMLSMPMTSGLTVADEVLIRSVQRRVKKQVLTLEEVPERVRLRR